MCVNCARPIAPADTTFSHTVNGKTLATNPPADNLSQPSWREKNAQPNGEGWETRLQFEVLEDYLMCAEMTQFAKNKPEHYAEMRGHFEKLKDFIRSELSHQVKNIEKKIARTQKEWFEDGFKEGQEVTAKEIVEMNDKYDSYADEWEIGRDNIRIHTPSYNTALTDLQTKIKEKYFN